MALTLSLQARLQQEALAQGGWLAFDRFMQAALLHPGEGYYARSDRPQGPFGASGDFQTAPAMGPWMGMAIAQAFERLSRELGPGLSILEVGPGTGALAAQVLISLAQSECLPERYWLDEPSPHLRALQRETIGSILQGRQDGSDLWSRVAWVNEAGFEPIRGLVIGHEVLDALPVKRLEWRGLDEAVLEWGLVWEEHREAWMWRAQAADPEHTEIVQSRARAACAWGGWRRGHFCEVAPGLSAFIETLWNRLAFGAFVFVDYGYEQSELDHPDRHRGTLAAHLHHRRLDDPEEWIRMPGSRDLTAHVDFTRLAGFLVALGASDLVLKSQTAWLLDQGLLTLAQPMLFPAPATLGRPPEDSGRLRALSDLQTLLSDAAMGQAFSVLSARKLLHEPGESM